MNSNQLGKQGERLFQQRMQQQGYTVQNVSGDPQYYDKDIDFIVQSPFTNEIKSFEVKFDSKIHKTNNLYLELTNINSKQWNGEGWWLHTTADFLAYGDAASRTFYIIPLLELRERVKQLPNRVVNCGYDSTGLLVSLADIADITKKF